MTFLRQDVQSIKVVYDFAVDGGVVGQVSLANAPTIPDNAICWIESYEVLTQFTSGAGIAFASLGFDTDGDFSSGISVTGGSWDVGLYLPWGSVSGLLLNSNPVKLSAARKPILTIQNEDLTAGKAMFVLNYYKGF